MGRAQANTLRQAQVCLRSADYFAPMADGHLGYGVSIGVAMAGANEFLYKEVEHVEFNGSVNCRSLFPS